MSLDELFEEEEPASWLQAFPASGDAVSEEFVQEHVWGAVCTKSQETVLIYK